MPIYEYQCLACGHQFEVMQGVNEKPPSSCPQCKKRRIKKQVSATHFQLKGTGWYVTDFKNPPKKPGSEAPEQGKESKESKTTDPVVGKDKSESTSNSDKETKSKDVKSNTNASSGEKGKKGK